MNLFKTSDSGERKNKHVKKIVYFGSYPPGVYPQTEKKKK